MHCLVLSDVFPSRLDPWRGPYNRRQVECLAKLCQVTVIAPLPWTRLLADMRSWGLVSKPDRVLEDVVVHHPVLWHVPLLGRLRTWRSVLSAANRALAGGAGGRFDVVLATFAYPHGLAAKGLSQRLGVPYVIKVRGSDLHSLPAAGARRRHVAEALRDAAAIVAVSRSLAGIAAELGARRENVHVLHNGVDIGSFAILPREQARERLGLDRRANLLLFVGNLLPVKGVDVLLDALLMAGKPALGAGRMTLAIAGDGPMRPWAERRVRRAGAEDAVRLLGHIPREQVALWMNAADVLVLPSRNEGCPNVVLEALACGTPVVASRVGAVPELVDDACGATVEPGEPAELARAVESVLSRQWDRAALRRRVEGMSWEANARGLHEVLLGAVARHGRAQ